MIVQQEQIKWFSEFFESGTCIVTSRQKDEPHLYVYGPVDDQKTRYEICDQITKYLNGKISRPQWFEDLKRTSENVVQGVDGTHISATGPYYDANPPSCLWKVRNDVESKNKRSKLITMLMK